MKNFSKFFVYFLKLGVILEYKQQPLNKRIFNNEYFFGTTIIIKNWKIELLKNDNIKKK